MAFKVCIGIDVGGTNTDAVVLYNRQIIAKCKQPTTVDVTVGVSKALSSVLNQFHLPHLRDRRVFVSRVNIGTTHFINAVLQRKDLASVAVIRLCGPTSRALPPFCDFPDDLKDVIFGGCYTYFIDGGYEFDGREIKSIRKDEVLDVISQIKLSGIKHIVVSGVFSCLCANQELAVGEILRSAYPEASFTLSHQVANMGLLERENSSILNESLKPLSRKSVTAFTKAAGDVGLTCPIFFTQNDGTVISAEKSSDFPVLTFSSGATNSMRGAAFLSEKKDAIVIDIGGTSTDVGVLMNGFPRAASTRVKCGGVTTNFRMPDVLSIALGGGSIVRTQNENSKPTIGPDSVGYELETRSLVYGGSTLTTTDITVAGQLCNIGDPSKVADLDKSLVDNVLSLIREKIEDVIDQVKVKAEDQPVVLVGGGSVLVDAHKSLVGASVVVKPEHFEVANAVGSALSQVSGTVDRVVDLTSTTRQDALAQSERLACTRAIENGARPDTVVIVEKSDIQLTYLKGNATRIQVKAVGDLFELTDTKEYIEQVHSPGFLKQDKDMSLSAVFSAAEPLPDEQKTIEKETQDEAKPPMVKDSRPFVDASSGDWLVNEFDLKCISTGAGILGCGGGGSPYLGHIRALLALKAGHKIRVIHPNNVPKEGLILAVAFMGAPSVLIERLVGGHECRSALEHVQNALVYDPKKVELGESPNGVKYVKKFEMQTNPIPEEKRIVGIMSAEIGGANSMEPLILGAELGLPVVDCDGMGRAFPELQMFTPSIYGSCLDPSATVDSCGVSEVVMHAKTAKDLENHLRDVIVTRMGCSAALAMAPLTAEQLLKTTVKFSMSRAWQLGHAVKMAQKEKQCPIKAILDKENGKLLTTGKVIDVERITEGGFNKGNVKVDGFGTFSGSSLVVSFQNENLIVERVNCDGTRELLATTPDLITLIESESGEPIPTEEVRYGLRVSVLVLPCSPLLTQEKALAVVGPQAFGYGDYSYKAIGTYKHCNPIPVPGTSDVQ